MKKLKRVLFTTKLYILFVPVLIWFLGCALNQAVIVANNDKFPVLINSVKAEQKYHPDENGMISLTHCVMTKDTHLNFLGDIFDFDEAGIYSIGDLMIDFGDALMHYSTLLWGTLLMFEVLAKDKKIKRLKKDTTWQQLQ